MYKKTVLSNGLRVVTEKIPSVRSISLGIWVEVGSRYETPKENGMSHLIEHMLFKGTKKRSAKKIAQELESVGGNLNAFTSKEHTCYTARIVDEHLEIATDVLADMTCNSRLAPNHLAMEKKVILEEIKESLENPSDHIHDLFSETIWRNQAIGRPILGDMESVSSIQRSNIVSYMKNYYRTGAIVIAAAGNISHQKLVDLVKDKFTFPEGNSNTAYPITPPEKNETTFTNNSNAQVHLCLGFTGPKYDSKLRMPALVVNTYLSGGMSSVLFQKVREQKGLAYSVYSFLDLYKDSGLFGTYAGTDKNRAAECIDIILKEFDKLKKRRISSLNLKQIKDQFKGQFALGMESSSARMNRTARMELYLGIFKTFDQTIRDIEKVTSSEVLEYANLTLNRNKMALAVLGPANKSDIKKVL
ncbi:MAG: pitrilysin family protein [bacterium]